MSFLETPRFPVDIRYGSTGGPRYNTDIVVTGGGVEYRNANWDRALYRYNAKYSIRTRAQAIEVYEFFQVSKGKFGGFRVKDFWDFTSAANGVDSPTNADQNIGTGDNVDTTFQIIKTYTQGANTNTRTITKPISGTLLVALNATPQTEGVDYTVDYTTGIITFTSAPGVGIAVNCGYEFDVPCRFDTDDLADLFFILNSANDDTDIISYPDIPLVEDRS